MAPWTCGPGRVVRLMVAGLLFGTLGACRDLYRVQAVHIELTLREGLEPASLLQHNILSERSVGASAPPIVVRTYQQGDLTHTYFAKGKNVPLQQLEPYVGRLLLTGVRVLPPELRAERSLAPAPVQPPGTALDPDRVLLSFDSLEVQRHGPHFVSFALIDDEEVYHDCSPSSAQMASNFFSFVSAREKALCRAMSVSSCLEAAI